MEYLNVAILNISVLNVRFILDFKTIISKTKYTKYMRDFGKCGIAKLDAWNFTFDSSVNYNVQKI